jgi:signal transduction histidine kinase
MYLASGLRAGTRRALQRIPGRQAVTIWTWALPLMLALTMTPFTAQGANASYWQQVSLQAYGVAAVTSAVALIAVRPALRRLRATTRAGMGVLLIYGIVAGGSVIASIMVLPALRAPDRPPLIGSVESVLLYAIAAMGAGGVAAWSLSWRASLRQALRESRLRARQAEMALSEQRDKDDSLRAISMESVEHEVRTPLIRIADRLDQASPEDLKISASQVRHIATDVVRPLSHSLHTLDPIGNNEVDDDISARVSWRKVSPLHQPLPVLAIWMLSVPGALLIPATGPGPLWAAIPDLGVLALGLMGLRALLPRFRHSSQGVQWILIIAGLAVVGSAAGIAFAISLGELWYSLIVTGAIVHVISGVALTLARGWGARMRSEIDTAQREAFAARTALAAEVVGIDYSRRHAADILHSRVQTRLLAIADLLDFGAAGNEEDLNRALIELRDTIEGTLPDVIRVLAEVDEAPLATTQILHGMWPDVDIQGAELLDGIDDEEEVIAGIAIEACANAVHHGGADTVIISREVQEGHDVLCVRDNGSGVQAELNMGLGTSAIAVHFPGWTLTNIGGWTELKLPLQGSNAYSRGAPAIAR